MFMKSISSHLSDVQVLFCTSLAILLLSGTILVARNELLGTVSVILENKYLGIFVLLVAFFMLVDTWAYVRALQAGADVGVLLGYVRAGGTVFTAILGVYFLGEKVNPIQWAGIALCVVGIFLILVFKSGEVT